MLRLIFPAPDYSRFALSQPWTESPLPVPVAPRGIACDVVKGLICCSERLRRRGRGVDRKRHVSLPGGQQRTITPPRIC